jgi:alpha-N-acetylglucosaminidase
MYASYYLLLWTLFLDALRAAAVAGKPLDEAATRQAIMAWERKWVTDDIVYRRVQPKDPVGEARALIQRLDRP